MNKPKYRRDVYFGVMLGLAAGTLAFIRLNGWAWGEKPFDLNIATTGAIATVTGAGLTQLLLPFIARVWLGWQFWAILLPWVYACGVVLVFVPLEYLKWPLGLGLIGILLIVRFAMRPAYDISRD